MNILDVFFQLVASFESLLAHSAGVVSDITVCDLVDI